MKLRIIQSKQHNPYINLAAEEQLTYSCGEDELILYLWQNEHSVVIGKNQNPWRECNVEQIKADNAYLARRMSGGGAVYHDLGNLNFTFIARDALYDIEKQTDVILLACRLLGINAIKTGRNDLLVDGRKFSGHAYYSSKGYNYHHGTIMLDVVAEDLPKYLQVSEAKLKSKGVASVRSRVVNLKEYLPWNSRKKLVSEMEKAMLQAFYRSYLGETPDIEKLELEELPQISEELIEKYSSEAWRLGTRIPFEKSIEHRFTWGEVEIQLNMQGSIIRDCKVYSDALETELFKDIEDMLRGIKYDRASISMLKRPPGASAIFEEIMMLIASSIE